MSPWPPNGGLGFFIFTQTPKNMEQFKISGVWKNQQVIADYAFHEVKTDGISRAKKHPKRKPLDF